MKTRKVLALFLASIIGISVISGCDSVSENDTPLPVNNSSDTTYAFVAKDVQNPYMQKVYEGFEKSCSEIGAKALYKGSHSAAAEKQIEIINELISAKVDGIAVAANDADALHDSLTAAMEAGISVVSLDSAVNKNSRQLHIQQANPEKIGKTLIQAAYDILNGKGGIAILSSTKNATNQNLWIEYMKKELEQNPSKYANMPLVKIVYGDDDTTKSAAETQALLSDNSIDLIIAPTTVGMRAAAKVIQDTQSPVRLTGLGLPSEMSVYIDSGICPWMYLWNPIEIGYLAAHALNALSNGTITGEEGGKFNAGELGEKVITRDSEGGTEVVLSKPFKFDYGNISKWKSVY